VQQNHISQLQFTVYIFLEFSINLEKRKKADVRSVPTKFERSVGLRAATWTKAVGTDHDWNQLNTSSYRNWGV
jgi:hypothetical protein